MKIVLLTLLLFSFFVLFAQDVKPIGENEEINFELLSNFTRKPQFSQL